MRLSRYFGFPVFDLLGIFQMLFFSLVLSHGPQMGHLKFTPNDLKIFNPLIVRKYRVRTPRSLRSPMSLVP